MSQFISWLITEKPRSTRDHFINDSLNAFILTSLILSILLLSAH